MGVTDSTHTLRTSDLSLEHKLTGHLTSMGAVDRMLEIVPEADSSLLLHLGNLILPDLSRGSVFDCFKSKEPFQAAPFHGDSFIELLILICCCSAMSESL